MIRQARAMVRDGKLGSIRKIYLEYHQGWLASDLESGGHKQASWRVDPAKAGLGGALGDIGTHAENLISFVTGLPMQSVYANLRAFVPNRVLDDDVSVFINFQQGAHGVLTASQVCIGEANGISLRIYGDKGGLSWYQQSENDLSFTELNGQTTIFTRNGVGLHTDSLLSAFTPPGHPEGYLEAFSNIYRGAIDAVLSKRDGIEESQLAKLIPSMKDGAQGVRFVEKCVESAEKNTQVDWES